MNVETNLTIVAEFGAFIAIVIECDWDRHHSTYGCLVKSDVELAKRWGCNLSTIWRYKKKLLEMGLLVKQNGLVKVKHFEWFEVGSAKQLAKIDFANKQAFIAKSQEIIADVKEDFADVQTSQVQSRPESFNVSSKGNFGLSNDDTGLSQEDIAWINKNIKEEQ